MNQPQHRARVEAELAAISLVHWQPHGERGAKEHLNYVNHLQYADISALYNHYWRVVILARRNKPRIRLRAGV